MGCRAGLALFSNGTPGLRRLESEAVRVAIQCYSQALFNRKTLFVFCGFILDPMDCASNKTMRGVEIAAEHSCVNETAIYESPKSVMACMDKNEDESKAEFSTGETALTYMSLKDSKESGNFYQSLQHPNIQTVEYENPAFTSQEINV